MFALQLFDDRLIAGLGYFRQVLAGLIFSNHQTDLRDPDREPLMLSQMAGCPAAAGHFQSSYLVFAN